MIREKTHPCASVKLPPIRSVGLRLVSCFLIKATRMASVQIRAIRGRNILVPHGQGAIRKEPTAYGDDKSASSPNMTSTTAHDE